MNERARRAQRQRRKRLQVFPHAWRTLLLSLQNLSTLRAVIGVNFVSKLAVARYLAPILAYLSCAGLLSVSAAHADELAAALYVRGDSDHTTVISPHVRAKKRLADNVAVDVSYAADVWTSASIDIRASASVRPVTEQRDELNLRLNGDWTDLHLRGGYRLSLEPDYASHGASVGAAYDLPGKSSVLDANLQVLFDAVGRSGDPQFSRALNTVDARLSFTQLLDALTILQATYELAHNQGYQASPYRFVGFGRSASGFGCLGAESCLPELVPRARTRHALALSLRRAQTKELSLGATYRYYLDDWSLGSHTLQVELGWNVAERSLLELRYRYYSQRGVDFYRRRYLDLDEAGYHTRDRELSGMSSHRGGVEFEQNFPLRGRAGRLAATLAVSGDVYHYRDFVGLGYVRALEVTAALLLEI